MAKGLMQTQSLHLLDLEGNRLGAPILNPALPLIENRSGDQGASHFGTALSFNRTLETLDLRQNGLVCMKLALTQQ